MLCSYEAIMSSTFHISINGSGMPIFRRSTVDLIEIPHLYASRKASFYTAVISSKPFGPAGFFRKFIWVDMLCGTIIKMEMTHRLEALETKSFLVYSKAPGVQQSRFTWRWRGLLKQILIVIHSSSLTFLASSACSKNESDYMEGFRKRAEWEFVHKWFRKSV